MTLEEAAKMYNIYMSYNYLDICGDGNGVWSVVIKPLMEITSLRTQRNVKMI
jgi:hypothetical protein